MTAQALFAILASFVAVVALRRCGASFLSLSLLLGTFLTALSAYLGAYLWLSPLAWEHLVAVAIFVIVVLAVLWCVIIEPQSIEVVKQEIEVANLPPAFEGFTVAFISDMHVGGWAPLAYYRKAAQIISRLNPEALLIGGDNTVSSPNKGWIEQLQVLAEALPHGLRLAIAGGHDRGFDLPTVRAEMEKMGFIWLHNQAIILERQGEKLALAGIGDNSDWPWQSDLVQTLESCGHSPCRILLAHSPDIVQFLQAGDFSLVICGHTHGGQVRLPLVGAVVRVTSLPRKCDFGLSNYNGVSLFTSKGLGSTVRLRLLCPPEICHLTFKSPA